MSSVLSMKVSDFMKKAITTFPNVTIAEIAKIMYENRIGSVVITSPDDKVLGIFTERDLTRVVAEGVPLDKHVGDVMTKNPVLITQSEGLSKAISLMYEKNVRHLPVVDNEGKIKGIISVRDLTSILNKLTSLE
ncbi:putative signal-transduction protein containing cAMP-binding and CBS domains [Caldisphaera lagunensis DSM 15908]|uniref:Putative signal-transduction protein containing cAMP-binding and CBS domains n=1 Tax=Caldisphaera lagunensis (strain DSM 15908 / JCM 11604 / ANMR 0165 / IC-154) TaxID=1056495 RepID=L0AD01_CALLD|nr:CBS domain-containing protein [Caldisphaera lagunensis]AFZ71017.1 putative signal-transduction protein containing cAMP-binding and CBS domains [Caldisphaera lagunensis DSM 15908]